MITAREKEKYREAALILEKVIKRVKAKIRSGTRLLDLADGIENEIFRLGGKPAFPVNISLNSWAAHYSPDVSDRTEIQSSDVVKVDIGVHIDGYIVDAAWTFVFRSEYERLVAAVEEALGAVIERIRAGVKTNKLGEVIEKRIRSFDLNPVRNLTGHMLKRYNLHAGKSIPNVKTLMFHRLKAGEVYAIEPFATLGKGVVKEKGVYTIFRAVKRNPQTSLNESEEKVFEFIWRRYNSLPFAGRWLKRRFEVSMVEMALERLVRAGCIHRYGVLVEETGGLVSQQETTVIVKRNGCEVLVGL